MPQKNVTVVIAFILSIVGWVYLRIQESEVSQGFSHLCFMVSGSQVRVLLQGGMGKGKWENLVNDPYL